MRLRRCLQVAGVVLVAALTNACGPVSDPLTPSSAGPIVVGSTTSTESKILAELYAQALAARGVPATTKFDLPSREAAMAGLQVGSVSIAPDYGGQLLLSLDENNPATTAQEVQSALPAVLPPGLSVLQTSSAADQDAYVMTKALAEKLRVTSLDDLGRVSGGVILGTPEAVTTLAYGPAGLTQIYGARLTQVKTYENPVGRAKALRAGRIQLATLRTTEAAIAADDLVVLEDPQAMILPQHVVPLVRAEVAANPTAVAAVAAVQEALTTTDLATLDQQVDEDGRAPGEAAAAWLHTKGLA